ncbi:MAG: biotin--[Prevotella sp.]|nr:biotin--[acetyl-CoA-carboxylase] ligase [Prevotella sp.]
MDFKVVHIDETDSTNRWLKEQRSSDVSVVVADYQTAGKGCGSNSWESERGKNLTFSVLLHPKEIPASCQFRISEIVSVALCKVLEQYLSPLTIKWPNDIYVGDRKICGILIENRLQGSSILDSIVGIGLNVNQTAFLSDAPNPVSMKQVLGREVDREELLQLFLKELEAVYAMDIESLSADYRQSLYRRDGFYDYQDAGGMFKAKLLNVQDDGRLVLLDTDGKARYYAFKEVSFII